MAFFAAALSFVCFFLSLFTVLGGESLQKVSVGKISKAPIVDGIADDLSWNELPGHRVSLLSGGEAVLKACADSRNIYLLLKFKGEGGVKYSRWHWAPTRQIYEPGGEKEDAFSILWSVNGDFDRGDLWVWRAALTNSSGGADDYFFTRKNKKDFLLRIDKGVNSWHAKYFSVFAGETVDRFYSRAPSGSAADVKAKGLWKKGEWILEFSRTLKSPNEDDIDFSDLKYIFVVFSAAMPDMSDFSTRSILEFEPEIYEKN